MTISDQEFGKIMVHYMNMMMDEVNENGGTDVYQVNKLMATNIVSLLMTHAHQIPIPVKKSMDHFIENFLFYVIKIKELQLADEIRGEELNDLR